MRASRHSFSGRSLLRGVAGLMVGALLLVFSARPAVACPFCTAITPTLQQRAETARVVLLGEYASQEEGWQRYTVHHLFQGGEDVELIPGDQLELPSAEPRQRGDLVLWFGSGKPAAPLDELRWESVSASEPLLVYFAQAPSMRQATSARLAYFAPYLQHADPRVAEDAYSEFGHAPYSAVVQVAELISPEDLQRWLADPRTPAERRGFFGLVLGMPRSTGDDAAAATLSRQRRAAYLQQLVVEPASDFRSGFDGILAGYLLAGGEAALELIDREFLLNPQAAEGDIRHLVQALRFYQEYGVEIPRERLLKSIHLLLDRPSVAAETIIDLARWEDWQALDLVAAQYPLESDISDAANRLRQAVVGYLLMCPQPAAIDHLTALRLRDEAGVVAAENWFLRFGGSGQ